MAFRTVIPHFQNPDRPEWMRAIIEGLRQRITEVSVDCNPLANIVQEAKKHRIWEKYLKDEPKTWERFWHEAIGEYTPEFVDKIVDAVEELRAQGDSGPKPLAKVVEEAKSKPLARREIGQGKSGPGRGKKTADNISRLYGTHASYLARRICRDAPAIFERLEAGKFKSIRQAAIAAGIVRVPTTLEKLLSLWAKASPQVRLEFLRFIESDLKENPPHRTPHEDDS